MRSLLNPKRSCKTKTAAVVGSLFISSIAFNAEAQTEPFRKNLIGVGGGTQWREGLGIQPVFNVNYERKLTLHSSIETGFRFSNTSRMGGYNYTTGKYVYSKDGSRVNYFTLPVLYKYSSNIVNIAAGPTLTLSNRHISDNEAPYWGLEKGKTVNKVLVGYEFKVGKTINLTDRLVLEPEVAVYGNREYKKFQTPTISTGVGIKYRF